VRKITGERAANRNMPAPF